MGFQRGTELGGGAVIVFDGVARAEDFGFFESGDGGEEGGLDFQREGGGDSVDVEFAGVAAFGFEDRIDYYAKGSLAEGMYASCAEAGKAFEAALPVLQRNEVSAIVAGPLTRIAYEPETVVVYGNSAQVLRLVNAALFEKGGSFKTEFTGRGDCADIVIRTRQSKEPQLILPCYGDRIFGLAADDEMAFTFPFAQAERIVSGLEGTHAGGIRYPVPIYQRFTAEYPATYQELERRWKAGGE